ncbi:hypothetical protein ACWFNE_12375 [Cellulomonas sp. NPDC055163]
MTTIRAAAPSPAPRQAAAWASEESWQHRVTLAHARIRELSAENTHLRRQLAVTHGELRAARTVRSL